jgi:hypothetical protein
MGGATRARYCLGFWRRGSARSRIQAAARQIKQILNVKADTTRSAKAAGSLAWPAALRSGAGATGVIGCPAAAALFFPSMKPCQAGVACGGDNDGASGDRRFFWRPRSLAEIETHLRPD